MITIERMTIREVREQRWNEFLAGLKPWESRRLFRNPESELLLHDAYVEGETTIRQIRLDLSFDVVAELDDYDLGDESDPRD